MLIILGGVAEWLKAADCKSARVAYVGSNPTPTTINIKKGRRRCLKKNLIVVNRTLTLAR